MIANIGTTDRIIRASLGIIIIALGFYFNSYLGLIGLVPLLTAFLRWCPAYLPFRISTLKHRE